jgi:ABC-type dipeptide/oligopeptide/nickel transport system permease subunit
MPSATGLPRVTLVAIPSYPVVLAFNFFGDAIRDVFDPKLRGSNSLTLRT